MTLKELQLIDNPVVRKIILENVDKDPYAFALSYNRKDYPISAIAEQIKSLQKAVKKLPRISKTDFIFNSTALEQASGEQTAAYKTSIIEGSKIIDLTGGLGIDSIHFAGKFEKVVYCEENKLLYELFLRNLKALGIKNIEAIEGDGTEILKSFPDKFFDWIYIDPSRRDSNKRLVGLENCSPNIITNLDLYFQKSVNILVKASPAIDYKKVKEQLPLLKRFIAVSVAGECKEILLVINRNEKSEQCLIEATILDYEGCPAFHLTKNEAEVIYKKISLGIMEYFYEPDAALIKTGLSIKLTDEKRFYFINNHIDYLTADQLDSTFPGRTFKVISSTIYSKRKIKEYLNSNEITSANIARRDFPDSPELIKHNLKLKDGGNDYLFFTKNSINELIFIHCKKPEI